MSRRVLYYFSNKYRKMTKNNPHKTAYMRGWYDAYRIGKMKENTFKTKAARAKYDAGFNKGMSDFERW